MSPVTTIVTLDEVKADLHITHDLDDIILQLYLDAAHKEALRFLDKTSFDQEFVPSPSPCETLSSSSSSSSSSSDWMPDADWKTAVLFLVRSKYDTTNPTDIQQYRQAAETLLMPSRIGLGV